MTHLDQVALVRGAVARQDFATALQIGRSELAKGCDSSELLVLMAAAVMLGDASGGTLEEARAWLETATHGDPRSIDAKLELGHFLDAVVDEGESATEMLQSAAIQALAYFDDALEALISAGMLPAEFRKRLQVSMQKSMDRLSKTENV